MRFDPDDDGLSDELAEEIRLELELGPQDESRGMAAVRAGDDEHLELVLSDEDGEEPDVVVVLTRGAARLLATALVALADDESEGA